MPRQIRQSLEKPKDLLFLQRFWKSNKSGPVPLTVSGSEYKTLFSFLSTTPDLSCVLYCFTQWTKKDVRQNKFYRWDCSFASSLLLICFPFAFFSVENFLGFYSFLLPSRRIHPPKTIPTELGLRNVYCHRKRMDMLLVLPPAKKYNAYYCRKVLGGLYTINLV